MTFTDNLESALHKGVDIIFASSSIQYVQNWQNIIQCFSASPWLLLDRVPLVDHPTDLVSIQVTPSSYTDTRYPGWKFSIANWLSRLSKYGFNPVFQWLVPEDCWTIFDFQSGQYSWRANNDFGFLLHQSNLKNGKSDVIHF